jgi:hypothetical protein
MILRDDGVTVFCGVSLLLAACWQLWIFYRIFRIRRSDAPEPQKQSAVAALEKVSRGVQVAVLLGMLVMISGKIVR